jgi:hypothetical protein
VSNNEQTVMVANGTQEQRVIHTTKSHPQVGWILYEGQKQLVHIGFWGGCPTWKMVDGGGSQEEYDYCAARTVDIENDPDYIGEEASE